MSTAHASRKYHKLRKHTPAYSERRALRRSMHLCIRVLGRGSSPSGNGRYSLLCAAWVAMRLERHALWFVRKHVTVILRLRPSFVPSHSENLQ